jgi:DNA-binding transcriptional LysR family regulator
MNLEPSWDLYRTFAAVLREGSLSAAARVLGLTQPSVARHVEALEQAVGGALFIRSQRGLSPTDRALALRPYAEDLEATSAALLRTASADPGEVAGTVRVTASEVVAVELLPRVFAALRQTYPAVAIELAASDVVDDLLQRRADIAVRMVEPSQKALVTRRAGTVTLGLHAREDYLARRGVPQSVADLLDHDMIGMDTMSPTAEAVMRALPGLDRNRFALRTDSTLAQMAAIRAGLGIGVCQVGVARREPSLRRILPEALALELPLWVAMHENLRTSIRCRTIFDGLAIGLIEQTTPGNRPRVT